MKGWKKNMVKCKQAENATCGKVICCFTCPERIGCDSSCEEFNSEDDFQKTGCEEAEEIGEMVDLNTQVPDVIKAISNLCTQKKQIEEQEKLMRQKLQEAMEQYGVKKFENDVISVTYVAPTTRTSIDSTKLKKELPDIAKKYSKTSNVSASVKITVKE